MIYATTKPIEEYGTGELGLYGCYGYDPALLALILLTTTTGYYYEREDAPTKKLVTDVDTMIATLDATIDGITVREHLLMRNPMQFHKFFENCSYEEIYNLPVCTLYKGNVFYLKMMVAARAAAWAVNYRGPVQKQGNIVRVNFKKGVTTEVSQELADLDKRMQNQLGEFFHG